MTAPNQPLFPLPDRPFYRVPDQPFYRMAYSAEWDGYDRAWHRSFAKSHADLELLRKGAEQAEKEIIEANRTP